MVEKVGLRHSDITLEITETILIKSIEESQVLLQDIIDAGYHIAMDDFGTGYSSLNYFKALQMQVVKIDKTFIDSIISSDYDLNIVKAMIFIAHSKGMKVTAEGVETNEQVGLLAAIGCDFIQGYFYSKPMSEQHTLDYIENHQQVGGPL